MWQLEGRELGKSSGAAHGKANIESYDKDWKKENAVFCLLLR